MTRHVSIVVPTFRRPELLAETLASISAQTHRAFDVLVCDNAGDPHTASVVDRLGDDRFRYLGRERNLGMLGNVLDGLSRAEGELVMELDDDDLLAPHCLETLAGGFETASDVTIAWSDLTMIDLHGDPLTEQTRAMSRVTGRAHLTPGLHRPFGALAAQGVLSTVSALIRRDAVRWDQIPLQVATAYDLHLTLEAAADSTAMWYTPERLVRYRLHPGSDSHQHLRAQLAGASFALRHALWSGRQDDEEAIRAALVAIDIRLARCQLGDGLRAEAVRTLRGTLATSVTKESLRLLGLAALPPAASRRILGARARRYVDPIRLNAHST